MMKGYAYLWKDWRLYYQLNIISHFLFTVLYCVQQFSVSFFPIYWCQNHSDIFSYYLSIQDRYCETNLSFSRSGSRIDISIKVFLWDLIYQLIDFFVKFAIGYYYFETIFLPSFYEPIFFLKIAIGYFIKSILWAKMMLNK